MATFGERLKALREQKELSQQELANRFNLSQSTIAYYELDRKQPSQATLRKLADFFDVSTDHLLGRTDDPKTGSEKQQSHPDWATKRDLNDLKKYLEQKENLNFDGVPITEEDKQTVLNVLTGLFWKAKEMNKRKKKDDTE